MAPFKGNIHARVPIVLHFICVPFPDSQYLNPFLVWKKSSKMILKLHDILVTKLNIVTWTTWFHRLDFYCIFSLSWKACLCHLKGFLSNGMGWKGPWANTTAKLWPRPFSTNSVWFGIVLFLMVLVFIPLKWLMGESHQTLWLDSKVNAKENDLMGLWFLCIVPWEGGPLNTQEATFFSSVGTGYWYCGWRQ